MLSCPAAFQSSLSASVLSVTASGITTLWWDTNVIIILFLFFLFLVPSVVYIQRVKNKS